MNDRAYGVHLRSPKRRFSSGSAALPRAALPNEARVTGPA